MRLYDLVVLFAVVYDRCVGVKENLYAILYVFCCLEPEEKYIQVKEHRLNITVFIIFS